MPMSYHIIYSIRHPPSFYIHKSRLFPVSHLSLAATVTTDPIAKLAADLTPPPVRSYVSPAAAVTYILDTYSTSTTYTLFPLPYTGITSTVSIYILQLCCCFYCYCKKIMIILISFPVHTCTLMRTIINLLFNYYCCCCCCCLLYQNIPVYIKYNAQLLLEWVL